MHVRVNLRTRFLLAPSALAAVLGALCALAVGGLVELLEDEMLARSLARHALLLGSLALGLATLVGSALARLQGVRERERAFTEDASHELRTPLAIIASAAEMLIEEPTLSQPGRERVLRIRRASGQMQSLLEALLFLARGEPDSPVRQFSLDQVVKEAAAGVAAAAAAKSIEVVLEIAPVRSNGVAAMAACVVNNLLLNAVNCTQSGRIVVQLTPATLLVRDTGVGIAPQDLTRIFERRYRGAQGRGLGLGLYLVSRVCERLGWRVTAESEPGRGTTFRIDGVGS